MKSFKICAVLLIAGIGTLGFGQTPAAAPPVHQEALKQTPAVDQPSREDVLRLFDAMHLRTQMESMIAAMNMQVKRQLQASLPKASAGASADAQAKLDSRLSEAANIYPVAEMMDDMIPIYQRHISKSDVTGIIAFYGSPAGQHLLAQTPLMMRESMAVVMPKANARMQAFVAKAVNESDAGAGKTPVGAAHTPAEGPVPATGTAPVTVPAPPAASTPSPK